MNFDTPKNPQIDSNPTHEKYGFFVKSEAERIVIEYAERLKKTKNSIPDEIKNILKEEEKIINPHLKDLIALEVTGQVMKIGKKNLKPAKLSYLAEESKHSGGSAYEKWEKEDDK